MNLIKYKSKKVHKFQRGNSVPANYVFKNEQPLGLMDNWMQRLGQMYEAGGMDYKDPKLQSYLMQQPEKYAGLPITPSRSETVTVKPKPSTSPTVRSIWEQFTGLPWLDARKFNLTDGTLKLNLDLLAMIKANPDTIKKIITNKQGFNQAKQNEQTASTQLKFKNKGI